MRVRVMIQVDTGILSGTPEMTKQFFLSSEEFYRQASDDGDARYADGDYSKGAEALQRVQEEALEYARSQMRPDVNNWVKVEWVWL